MDASGEEALEMLVKRVRSAGMGFAMCGLKGQVIDVMQRTGLYDEIGEQHLFPDSKNAVAALIGTPRHHGLDTQPRCVGALEGGPGRRSLLDALAAEHHPAREEPAPPAAPKEAERTEPVTARR